MRYRYPQVDVEPPEIEIGNEEAWYDRVTEFATEHPRPIVVAAIVVLLMILIKKPVFRGILLGVGFLALVLLIARGG
jgi:hypothetical protein